MGAIRSQSLIDGAGRVHHDVALHWDAAGLITAITPAAEAPGAEDLGAVMVVAGRINAHSHAFQRVLRGRVERLNPARPHDDFWTWRETMYGAAGRLTPESLYAVSRMAFLEMALSGITAVGEFHYIHHQPDGTPYADPNELAHRVIAAARSVGIRITLLRVAYERAGAGKPPTQRQRRFVDGDAQRVLQRVDDLAAHWRDEPAVNVGLAPHSLRAVGPDWLRDFAQFGRQTHLHACEQTSEIAQVLDEYGVPPVAALEALGLLGPHTTLVHATHLSGDAPARLARTQSIVCACPSTERNLGDGFLPVTALQAAGVPICLGSDSHVDIDLWEEARLVEYHERLRQQRRCVLATATQPSVATALEPMASRHGALSLGLNTGALEVGRGADFVALDLNDPRLADAAPTLDTVTFGASPRAVRSVFVAGKPIVQGGRHPAQKAIVDAFLQVATG